MNISMKTLLLGTAAAVALASSALAADKRILKYNADFDPTPLKAFEALIADFEAANPDVDVVLTNFDHEGYKTAIRNFLTADCAGSGQLVRRQPHGALREGRPVPGRHRCLGCQWLQRAAGFVSRLDDH